MVKESISINEVVDFLNDLLRIDSMAINSLFNLRVGCNKELADHPTVQVGSFGTYPHVGMIGILNGVFGADESGYGCIFMDIDNGKIKQFRLDEARLPDSYRLNCKACGVVAERLPIKPAQGG